VVVAVVLVAEARVPIVLVQAMVEMAYLIQSQELQLIMQVAAVADNLTQENRQVLADKAVVVLVTMLPM
jgi:hypothetical protein